MSEMYIKINVQLEKKTSEKRTKKQPIKISFLCQSVHLKKTSNFHTKRRERATQLFYQQHTHKDNNNNNKNEKSDDFITTTE